MAVAALTAVAGSSVPLQALARSYATGVSGVGDTLRYPLPAVDGATIDGRNRVIIVRYRGSVHAFSLECPHRGTMVQWQPDRGRFYCPKHKSTFQPEGTIIQGKAKRNLDRYAVRIEGAELVVDRAVLIKNSADAAAWTAAGAKTN